MGLLVEVWHDSNGKQNYPTGQLLEARESFKALLDRVETVPHVTRITRRHAMEKSGRDELLVHGLIEPDQADAVD